MKERLQVGLKMMDDDDEIMLPGLMIAYRGSEWTPDGATQYLAFTARMVCDGFSGTAEFEASASHLLNFAQALQSFYESLSGQPELQCGWGERIDFLLRFSQHDKSGHVLMECHLQDTPHSLHSSIVIELYQVHLLAQFMQANRDAS